MRAAVGAVVCLCVDCLAGYGNFFSSKGEGTISFHHRRQQQLFVVPVCCSMYAHWMENTCSLVHSLTSPLNCLNWFANIMTNIRLSIGHICLPPLRWPLFFSGQKRRSFIPLYRFEQKRELLLLGNFNRLNSARQLVNLEGITFTGKLLPPLLTQLGTSQLSPFL